jgi:hypothetical protein
LLQFMKIQLSKGLWDLVGWVKMEALKAAPIQITIAEDLMEQWIDRAERFVDMVERMFPSTFMLWRTLHYCKVGPHLYRR